MKKNTKQRTPQQSAALDAAIVRAIYTGRKFVQVASEQGCTESYVYTIARRRLGYESALLSPTERWIVLQMRAKPSAARRVGKQLERAKG